MDVLDNRPCGCGVVKWPQDGLVIVKTCTTHRGKVQVSVEPTQPDTSVSVCPECGSTIEGPCDPCPGRGAEYTAVTETPHTVLRTTFRVPYYTAQDGHDYPVPPGTNDVKDTQAWIGAHGDGDAVDTPPEAKRR